MIRNLVLSLSLTALAACESSAPAPAPQPQTSPTPATESTTLVAKAPEPVVDLESVPVEEDFEQEAEKQVSPTTLSATLDELEKEISAE